MEDTKGVQSWFETGEEYRNSCYLMKKPAGLRMHEPFCSYWKDKYNEPTPEHLVLHYANEP